MQNQLERTCRAIGRQAAARGRSVELVLAAAADAKQRLWIRQGHDSYMARFSDRKAA